MRRSDQRREAAFAIYQQEVTARPLDELLGEARPFTRALAEGTSDHLEELDSLIAEHARGWRLERIAPLEKAIMRVALYEINHREDIPTPVAIDEAVSIAGRYCGSQAPSFVNGILAAASSDGSADARGPGAPDGAPA
jgi:N utilization substance protein B